ncbi:MAG: glycosyltransferase, partial [Muribaculaceae bacterium]|nr:glycosyltransferase [Muribaculaceae bacterium]
CQKVIYNIVDKEKIDSLSKKENVTTSKFTIISIGRLVEVKGFDKIIKIASALKNKGYDLKFCILGIGELEYQLKDMAKTYGVEDVVEFLGFKNNPYPYLANSDIFLSTSISEAFSLVVAEALCLGVPVISTKTTGPIEIIDNEYGILTEHNEDDIMNAIIRLIEDPKLRLLYKNKAKERACMFDTTKTMNKIYTILGK